MNRPPEDDRPIFTNLRHISPQQPRLTDITPEDVNEWKTMEAPRTPEEVAQIERDVDSAIETARKASQRLLAQKDEEVPPALEDLARAATAHRGSPSGRLPEQQWGTSRQERS